MAKRVPQVDDRNHRRAKATAAAVIPLQEYQLTYILDRTRIKVAKWCRQAGKDFTTSLEAVIDGLETKDNWYIVSLTLRQAEATIKKVQQHCKAINGAIPDIIKGDYTYYNDEKDALITIKTLSVVLPGGAVIEALPGRDPDALAGLTGNVIFTEMALFPGGGKAHWTVIFPLASRGYKIRAISTPRGVLSEWVSLGVIG